MTLALSAGAQRFRDNFTFKVFPFLSPLVEALRVLQEGRYVDEKITLLLGAPQLEIRIHSEVGDRDASLCVDFWPDSRRSKLTKPPLLFSFSSTRREMVSAFVGALKRLRASASDPVLMQEYGSWFPTAEYERLLAAVE
jgi:hypothetical protein